MNRKRGLYRGRLSSKRLVEEREVDLTVKSRVTSNERGGLERWVLKKEFTDPLLSLSSKGAREGASALTRPSSKLVFAASLLSWRGLSLSSVYSSSLSHREYVGSQRLQARLRDR